MRIGYACLNQTLSDQKITVNRGMIRKTFDEKGLPYVAELITKNLHDLKQVINWNISNNIQFYRLSSDMLPWMSEYEIDALPDFSKIASLLSNIGEQAKEFNIRLTYHPGPFNVLASEKEAVVKKTIKELNQHAQIMDLMNLEQSPFNKINIHIGTTLQGNKEKALNNFCRNFEKLTTSTQCRLTVENDDKASMFSVEDLYHGIYKKIGIPIVFDYHHHVCNTGGLSEEEALKLAISTWPEGVQPVAHYSEPRSLEEKKLFRAHADYIYHKIPTYGLEFDIMLEAKQKEGAVLSYREQLKQKALKAPLFEKIRNRAEAI